MRCGDWLESSEARKEAWNGEGINSPGVRESDPFWRIDPLKLFQSLATPAGDGV
jgi:hypothetical protein